MLRPATLIALSLLACPVAVRGQSPGAVAPTEARTPDEERKAFHLPPGFEAQLVAEEPEIDKPMNLAFDDRGRLWVTTPSSTPIPRRRAQARDRSRSSRTSRRTARPARSRRSPTASISRSASCPWPTETAALVHAIPDVCR